MSQPEPPKIEFPCDYPIKVIGKAAPDFKEFVIETVSVHAPDLDIEQVDINASRNGNFVSVRLSIIATGKEQLDNLFKDLKASGRVTMVI
ncbi:YbeD family protein [Alkalimarinus coralli]|uniref:HP0495 family protein n=1 Tax=Alkalimarinus coralli TaxID=2935863 RepID=UPI00202B709A|nr:DUF493 domain-containing protein [Alkalimarinus coralli]